jgi:F-type H+-transporting ATPase subunit a
MIWVQIVVRQIGFSFLIIYIFLISTQGPLKIFYKNNFFIISGLFFSFETNSLISFSQISLFYLYLLPFLSIFYLKSRFFSFFKNLIHFLKNELKPLLGYNYHFGSLIIFLSLIIFIILRNLQGLFRYTFTWSSHLLFSLILGLPFWFSILFIGFINNLQKNLRHLVPNGTPIVLISFIVLIETLRIIIRPITLSVRLAANITAGHLLLRLIRWSSSFYLLNIIIQIIMFGLEIMVAIIQSYVFTILLILYIEEEN